MGPPQTDAWCTQPGLCTAGSSSELHGLTCQATGQSHEGLSAQPHICRQPILTATCGLAAALLDLRPSSHSHLLLCPCQKENPIRCLLDAACAVAGWRDCLGSGLGAAVHICSALKSNKVQIMNLCRLDGSCVCWRVCRYVHNCRSLGCLLCMAWTRVQDNC